MLRATERPFGARPSQNMVRGSQEEKDAHLLCGPYHGFVCTFRMGQNDEVLRRKFTSTETVPAEMCMIRCVEHTGRMKFITPFVGSQIGKCKALGFSIPDYCALVYVSKAKSLTRRRGRPAQG